MMARGLVVLLGVLWLSGCDDAPRVERKTIVEPGAQSPHTGGAPAESPHGITPPAGAAAAEDLSSPVVNMGLVQLTAPKSWVRKPPPSGFTRAEFALPKAEGDKADGRLTLSMAGGDIKANIDRWRGQFAGKPSQDKQEQIDVAGISITMIDITGTFNDQRGMMGPVTACPDYRLLGAIFDVGGQMHFIKSYGPAKTMAARSDEFKAFLRSLKKN